MTGDVPIAIKKFQDIKKLQEQRSIAKLKMLHRAHQRYKFVTLTLLPPKAQDNNIQVKPMLSPVKMNN